MTKVSNWLAVWGGILFAIACGPKRGSLQAVPSTRRPAADSLGRSSVSGEHVAMMSLGGFHSCAVSDRGNLRCWGRDTNGASGGVERRDAGAHAEAIASALVPFARPVVEVSSGLAHDCALDKLGEVSCWGVWKPAPHPRTWQGVVQILSLGAPAKHVVAGDDHSCVLMASGDIRCWGGGRTGALGYGNSADVGDDEDPAEAGNVSIGGSALQVVIGDGFTCALLDSHRVRCWGEDVALGNPARARIGATDVPSAFAEVDIGGDVKALAAGSSHVCALLVDSSVRCWGGGAQGTLGLGNQLDVGDDETPSAAGPVDLGAPAIQLAAGVAHTCALLTNGRVRCWGQGQHGQLGYGNKADVGDDEVPASAGDVDLGGDAVAIAAGGFHSCAMLKGGCVRCWGLGADGQLGYANIHSIGDDEVPATAGCVHIF